MNNAQKMLKLAARLAVASDYGLNLHQLQILLTLGSNLTPMSEIARATTTSRAAATGMADGLEKLGLVRREHGRADRRRIHLTLTERGYRARAHILSLQPREKANEL